MITRRMFLSFVALGGVVSSLRRRIGTREPEREARFWEPLDETAHEVSEWRRDDV